MKHLLPVSSDEGITWKKRWISTTQRDPKFSELKVGELVKVGEGVHKVILNDGRIECPLVKCEEDEHDWESSTWSRTCKKCSLTIKWIIP